MFQKKDIDQKLKEFGGSKRPMALKKLIEVLKKYSLNQLIIKTKDGKQHYVGHQEVEKPPEDEVKQ